LHNVLKVVKKIVMKRSFIKQQKHFRPNCASAIVVPKVRLAFPGFLRAILRPATFGERLMS